MSKSDGGRPILEQLTHQELLVLVEDLLTVNGEQQARIVRLEEEVSRLKGGTPPAAPRQPPAFIKPNRKTKEERKAEAQAQEPKRPRKRRPHGFARRKDAEAPTQVVEHFPERCSCCGFALRQGGWVHAHRHVIELPWVPVEVTEHRVMARRCGACGRREVARLDLAAAGQVVGRSRLGVRLMSFIAYLDTVCRMPIETIQRLLKGLYGLRLSQGAIVRVLHRVAQAGQPTYEGLLGQLRRCRVLHVDETGAREDGINGYEWVLSNQQARYYHRDASRAAAVIQELLGYNPTVYQARSARGVRQASQASRASQASPAGSSPTLRFHGGLVSDFYTGYDWYPGVQQKCLVHLDRDLDELKAQHPQDPAVGIWVEKVLELIERAKDYASQQRQSQLQSGHPADNQARRAGKRRELEREAVNLARPYANGNSALPQRVLADRLLKYRHRLFVFVEHLEVPADNNAAERSIRPFVVLRKVSGGTRSPKGSQTQDVLLSLFGTWLLRGQDALQACHQMLMAQRVPEPG